MKEETQILNPKEILLSAGLGGSESMADFGCGPGMFTIPAAELTEGIVYALDVQKSVLEAVVNQIHIHNIPNIITKQVNLETIGGSQLEDNSISFVLIRKILLQNERKDILLKEAHRILKNKGVLIVVGWTNEALIGPNVSDRIEQKELLVLTNNAGFIEKKQLLADNAHYAIAFSK